MSRFALVLMLLVGLTQTACNETEPVVVTESQRKNDAFVEVVSKQADYTKLLFLNEEYPIYYRVLKSASTENKDKKPLQNSKVSAFVKGVIPNIQLLNVEEIKALKSVSEVIAQGQVFQQLQDSPSPLWVYNRDTSSSEGSSIKGVQIALQNMAVGDKWEVVVPWQLGYGQSYYSVIPGYSTLVFEIELVEILQL